MRNSKLVFFFSSRRRHTRLTCDWSSDVCSSDLFFFRHQSLPYLRRRLRGKGLEFGGCEKKGQDDGHDGSAHLAYFELKLRSEERRVGKECRSQWSASPPYKT